MKILFIQTRNDGIGSQMLPWLAQIILGHYNNYYISHIPLSKTSEYSQPTKNMKETVKDNYYFDNIFFLSLNKLIDNINKDRKKYNKKITYPVNDVNKLLITCCITIKQDMVSYFRENFLDYFNLILDELIKERYKGKYKNIMNVISLHVRLQDVYNRNNENPEIYKDYDGDISYLPLLKFIDDDKVYNTHTDNIIDAECRKKLKSNDRSKNLYYNAPSLISLEEGEKIIKIAQIDNNINAVNCVCSPIGELHFQYERISNEDFIEDLLHLIFSKITIATKSSYAVLSLFFHRGDKSYASKWGRIASLGLGSKYDKSNVILF